MDNQMDNIISQLSHIEDTAVRIMESADNEKKQIAAEMEKKTKDFDDALTADTAKQLEAIRSKLEQKKQMELELLRKDAEDFLNELNQKYEKNHSIWAKEVLDSMIEV